MRSCLCQQFDDTSDGEDILELKMQKTYSDSLTVLGTWH